MMHGYQEFASCYRRRRRRRWYARTSLYLMPDLLNEQVARHETIVVDELVTRAFNAAAHGG